MIERDHIRQEKSVLAIKTYNDSFEQQYRQDIEPIGDEDEGFAGPESREAQ